ncbi:MAG: sigma-70 family RNA polymerase sigma factor [Myxococcaceae bacterium]|nr:sigma-70 family RNA polymerase sigma factor [Myxococcaceae bacterium]
MNMSALPPIDELYRAHRRRALAIVRRIVKDADDAEDVVQEVFARLSFQNVRFDGKAACSTWLHRILVNSSINALRAQKRRGRLESGPNETADPLDQVLHDERHQQFMRALKVLSPQHQQLLTLRELRGMSYPDIARVLHLPEGTVKSALNRGRTKLLEAMASQGVAVTQVDRPSLFKPAPTPGRSLRRTG